MINNGKSKIDDTGGSLTIKIPSKKNWFFIIFALLWAFGWFYGFKTAINDIGFGEAGVDGFMLFWTMSWSAVGLFVLFFLLWGFFGFETVIIENGLFHLKKTIFNIGISKKFETHEVKNIRIEKVETGLFSGNRWSIYGLGPGKVKFDYGLKTYSFGLSVDDAEANYLLELLTKKIKYF